MDEKITIYINNKKIKAAKSETILSIAQKNGIFVPSLCYHSDLKAKASCRLCLVEIELKGKKFLTTSCSAKAGQGMKIKTETEEIRKLRKTNLELLASQHQEECFDCVYQFNCELKQLAKEYKIDLKKFNDRKKNFPYYQFKNALVFDSSKCIDCRNCVEACAKQGVGYLTLDKKNGFFNVVPSKNKACILCGQCLIHCPVGAFEAVGEFEAIEEPLKNKKKTLVFQIAPSIRTSIGEDFGFPIGQDVMGKIVSGIKKLGADFVFDVAVGADFTTYEEATELLEKLKEKEPKLLLSSCCPSWVRFLEKYYPDFVKNLSIARPPHIISGGLIKTYFAQKQKLNPEDIVVVSVMPCVAKKYEITRPEFQIASGTLLGTLLSKVPKERIRPVDFVLTTRELSFLFRKKGIDLKTMPQDKCDSPLGAPSGAGVIYGASGGVMESALRMAFWKIEKKVLPKIVYEQVRGQEGIKKAIVEIGGKKIKIVAVSGTGNAKIILEELKKNPTAYSCVEVMACPGGCIGGGGQPMPQNETTRKLRAQGLYAIDKTNVVKIASENPIVKKIYKDFLFNKEARKHISQAKYK